MLNDTSANKLLSVKKRLKQALAAQKVSAQNAATNISPKPADDVTIFRDAVKDVTPLPRHQKFHSN